MRKNVAYTVSHSVVDLDIAVNPKHIVTARIRCGDRPKSGGKVRRSGEYEG